MARVYDNAYWTGPARASASKENQFTTLGHPGKYYSAFTYTSGQVDFTGSNYGYGAILVNGDGDATASLSGGGEIILDQISTNIIHELSVSQIKGGSGASIYLFKRQQ